MTSDILTQARLKSLYSYCASSGLFTKKVSTGSTKAGHNPKANHAEGYIVICIDKKPYLAHRLAFLFMNGELPHEHVDHINHIRDDNRWVNLREATWKINQKNMTMRLDNKSGHCGVSLHKPTNRWRAHIMCDGVLMHLGLYDSIETAVAVRESAEKLLGFHPNHGRVIPRNIPCDDPPLIGE